MMFEEAWNKLKDHAKKQEGKYKELNHGISGIGKHIWKDVLNQMWILEKEIKKRVKL